MGAGRGRVFLFGDGAREIVYSVTDGVGSAVSRRRVLIKPSLPARRGRSLWKETV